MPLKRRVTEAGLDLSASLGLLLHGALLSRQATLPLLNYLPADMPWIVPDLIGHGQQRERHTELLRLDPGSIADNLYRRLPCIHSNQRIILVGHSLGALVAIELVRRYQLSGQLILGDPPLWPCGDTESQLEAQRALALDVVGRRLLVDSFGDFNGSITYDQELADLGRGSNVTTTIVIGMLGRHQRANGGWDCGTFINHTRHASLSAWVAEDSSRRSLIKNSAAGHFVLHDQTILFNLGQFILDA